MRRGARTRERAGSARAGARAAHLLPHRQVFELFHLLRLQHMPRLDLVDQLTPLQRALERAIERTQLGLLGRVGLDALLEPRDRQLIARARQFGQRPQLRSSLWHADNIEVLLEEVRRFSGRRRLLDSWRLVQYPARSRVCVGVAQRWPHPLLPRLWRFTRLGRRRERRQLRRAAGCEREPAEAVTEERRANLLLPGRREGGQRLRRPHGRLSHQRVPKRSVLADTHGGALHGECARPGGLHPRAARPLPPAR